MGRLLLGRLLPELSQTEERVATASEVGQVAPSIIGPSFL